MVRCGVEKNSESAGTVNPLWNDDRRLNNGLLLPNDGSDKKERKKKSATASHACPRIYYVLVCLRVCLCFSQLLGLYI